MSSPISRTIADGRGWLQENFFRLAATGLVPARWFLPDRPESQPLPGRPGPLQLEIVSHCWNYAHLLAYQLSSLVLYPPRAVAVRMTVYYCPEDAKTGRLLAHFGGIAVPQVTWDWRPLERTRLLRRAIGRNLAAKATTADWIWFTDCDVWWHAGSLDALAARLAGCRERLVFPRQEHCTRLLREDDPVLLAAADRPGLVQIDPREFAPAFHDKAVGPLQIVHGDTARRYGYCDAIGFYQRPVPHWRKTYEDRTFRWLLGTEGMPIEVPGIYRIKHLHKGRYRQSGVVRRVRQLFRRGQSRFFGRARGEGPRNIPA